MSHDPPAKPGRPPLPPSARADSQIQLRVTRARKAAYVRAANRHGQTLAAWMFDACDRRADYEIAQDAFRREKEENPLLYKDLRTDF